VRTVAIIQARLGSSRYPRKVLEDINGKPMIAHVVERAKAIEGVDEVVVACPSSDDEIVALEGACVGVRVIGAREAGDVLGRFADVAQWVEADVAVRLTADCPMLAPDVATRVLSLYRDYGKCDYATNILSEHYIDGMDVEVFSAQLLYSAERLTWWRNYDREHVTPWLRRHAVALVAPSTLDRQYPKLSVDTPEDLERVRAIMAKVKGLTFADTLAACAEAGV
jgi:spore coat polysaccharide biosynthesis protein SpsF (cytidylyltransferase family)